MHRSDPAGGAVRRRRGLGTVRLMAFRRILAVGAAAVLLAACTDGDGGDEGAGRTGVAQGPRPEFTDFCVQALQTETYPEPGVDLSRLSPPEQVQVVKAYASGLVAQAERVRALAPEEIRTDVNVIVDGMVRIRDTGDFKVLEEERVVSATRRVHAFELENCGWARQDVVAVDHAYRGLPRSVAGGPRSFELENEGKETHELVVLKINDNVTDPVDKLLELPREQVGVRVTNAGSASAQPGEQSFVVADLTPGRYALVCFIPVGGVSEGPPHFTRGMQAELRVS